MLSLKETDSSSTISNQQRGRGKACRALSASAPSEEEGHLSCKVGMKSGFPTRLPLHLWGKETLLRNCLSNPTPPVLLSRWVGSFVTTCPLALSTSPVGGGWAASSVRMEAGASSLGACSFLCGIWLQLNTADSQAAAFLNSGWRELKPLQRAHAC